MKGEINFELKADNIIIHGPLTLQNTLLIFWDTSWWNKQDYIYKEERKGQATQGNSTWRTGMAGLFARVWDYAVFHPRKDKMFHFYTLIKMNCTLKEFNW